MKGQTLKLKAVPLFSTQTLVLLGPTGPTTDPLDFESSLNTDWLSACSRSGSTVEEQLITALTEGVNGGVETALKCKGAIGMWTTCCVKLLWLWPEQSCWGTISTSLPGPSLPTASCDPFPALAEVLFRTKPASMHVWHITPRHRYFRSAPNW